MSGQKKFGAFAGVFTPSLLTILGVIMYMRLGWVVGNAGLIGTIAIIVVAHIISVTTGLSISSIATDKKVGAGGVYYVLSRSLGLPIGGAIGITLFVGTAMSIALYLIGFAESFLPYFGLESDINGLRIGGSLALLALTILAFISTSLALKTQFFILAAIIISLVSIFLGVSPEAPKVLAYAAPEGGVSLEVIFAVFFPAVTGFTAGIAMSGDLKDPKKSIPNGTLWSIAVGFVVYIVLAIFIFYAVDGDLLRSDNSILLKLALFAPAVVAGIWGATLSSALGGILGGPRIMQAMSIDKITPRLFAKGVGSGNEPRNALLLTVLIAEAGILIGELDTIARVCSMFYLAAYGFINLSFFLESWASSDFKPTFKVKRWVGLLGFIATFIVMFKLDMVAMIGAFVVIGGIYFWLAKREIALGSGDVWQSVWSSVVKTGLRRMDEKQDHQRNWKPNILLFSGGTEARPHLLEFSTDLVGKRGIVTNFDLIENKDAAVLFPKHQQSVSDEQLKKYGVFGRKLEVQNVFRGIETIASTFGFSGIEPNTVLMGWAKNTKDPIWFSEMTTKLVSLDYNVLYLDYDERFGFRKHAEIDLWWRGTERNAELMLNICKFLTGSDLWRNAQLRILLVDETNGNKKILEKKIENLLDVQRMSANIKIIGNAVEQKPIYELMKIYSSETDLILVGIPDEELEQPKTFVSKTNDLVHTIGTTLLVQASSHFTPAALSGARPEEEDQILPSAVPLAEGPTIEFAENKTLNDAIAKIHTEIAQAYDGFSENVIAPTQEKYIDIIDSLLKAVENIEFRNEEHANCYLAFLPLLEKTAVALEELLSRDLPLLSDLFEEEGDALLDNLEAVFDETPKKLILPETNDKIAFRRIAYAAKEHFLDQAISNTYGQFGNSLFLHSSHFVHELIAKLYHLFDFESFAAKSENFIEESERVLAEIKMVLDESRNHFAAIEINAKRAFGAANAAYGQSIAKIAAEGSQSEFWQHIKKSETKKANKLLYENLLVFPDNWARTQTDTISALQNDAEMARVQARLNINMERTSRALDSDLNSRLDELFAKHQEILTKVKTAVEDGTQTEWLSELTVEEAPMAEGQAFFQNFESRTQNLLEGLKEEVVLINSNLYDQFEALQFEGPAPIKLDAKKIANFIVETKIFGPFQKELEKYSIAVSNLFYNQSNRVNLLKFSIEEADTKALKMQLVDNIISNFESDQQTFETTKLRFAEYVRGLLYEIHMELNSRYLAANSENWNRFISVSKRKKGLSKITEKVRNYISNSYQSVNQSLSTKRHESLVAGFSAKHSLKSDVELGRELLANLQPKFKVDGLLPFYYKQLFTGKHLPVQGDYIGRGLEMQNVMAHIQEKNARVLLIGGQSGAGKTHFASHLALRLGTAKHLTISPMNGKGTIANLDKVIAAATQYKGTAEQCIDSLKKPTTIIVERIECWWTRSADTDALKKLLEIIWKYKKRHKFILLGNLYALEAMRHLGKFEGIVDYAISLPPVSKEAIKAIILERHKIGGIELAGITTDELENSKEVNALITKIHQESMGNVGLSLMLWLRSIDLSEEGKFVLREFDFNGSLKIANPLWLWLLYQLTINERLSVENINKLFGQDAPELLILLSQLHISGLVERLGRNCYTLNSISKPSIEVILEQNGILN